MSSLAAVLPCSPTIGERSPQTIGHWTSFTRGTLQNSSCFPLVTYPMVGIEIPFIEISLRRSRHPFPEACHRVCPPLLPGLRLLFPVFPYSEKRMQSPPPPAHSGPPITQQVHTKIQVPDGHALLIIMSLPHRARFTALDMKDGYFHINIHPAYWKFLLLQLVIPIISSMSSSGIATTPHVFKNVFSIVTAHMQCLGHSMFPHLDDWLLVVMSRNYLLSAIQTLHDLLTNLGICVRGQVPTQQLY
ncbi:unnamed protein product [Caretta caretta]